MTATTKKTLVITAIITAIIFWFYRKKANGNPVKNAIDDILSQGNGQTVNAPDETLLFINQDSSFEDNMFYFITPVGSFTIANPDTSSPAYHSLHNDANFQFGWQAPTPGVILVTLMPMQQHPIVENIVLDLEQETIEFEYVQL